MCWVSPYSGNVEICDLGECSVHFLRRPSIIGISFAEEMDENGILSISKLNQLKVLKLKRAKNVKADDFVTLFANKNLCKLQNLDLR